MNEDLYYIQVDIKSNSPILITSTVGDENMVNTEDYITGSAIRGLFANMFIERNGKASSISLLNKDKKSIDFSNLFFNEQIFFLNGYPILGNLRLLPTPLSVGYKKGETTDVADDLFKMNNDNNENRKPAGGYCYLSVQRDGEHKLSFKKENVDIQHQFHHERTNQRIGRSVKSEIYNYESISSDQQFRSIIVGRYNDLDLFMENFDNNIEHARLGRSKTTQYGKVNIKLSFSNTNKFATETNIFNDKNKYLSLTFISDVILLDGNGHSCVRKELVERELKEFLKKHGYTDDGNNIRIIKSYVKDKTVENYIGVWKARTPSQTAFKMGSCFLLELPKDQEKREKIIHQFKILQKEGIGIRKNEGFGRIAFGWQSPFIFDADESDKINAIDSKPSESVKIIFQRLIKARLLDVVRSTAAKYVEQFSNYEGSVTKVTSTQIHKLEYFISVSSSLEKFKKDILDTMTNNAKERLIDIKYDDGTLYEFLSKNHFEKLINTSLENLLNDQENQQEKKEKEDLLLLNWREFFKNNKDDKKEFFETADYNNYIKSNDLEAKLFHTFYNVFFSLLDKKLKTLRRETGHE